MELIINLILNFVIDGEERITPDKWNDRVLMVNSIISAIINGLTFILVVVLFGLLLFALGDEFSLGSYTVTIGSLGKFILFLVLFVYFVYLTYKKVSDETKENEYLEVKNGQYGLINLLGKPRGSLDEPFVLTPGNYRDITDFGILAKNIFSIVILDMRLPAMEFEYEEVKSRDGAKFSGKHSFLPFTYDPWTYHQLLFSMEYSGIRNLIEEISLEKLYTTFDEFHSEEIMGAEKLSGEYADHGFNVSLALRDNYLNSLSRSPECKREGKHADHLYDFYTKNKVSGREKEPFDVYCLDTTGLVGRFLLKTFNASEEVQKAYDEKAAALAGIAKAKYEALAKKKTVKADRKMIESLIDSTLRKYKDNLGDKYKITEEAIKAAKEDAMIVINSFNEENIYRLSTGDGKSLDALSSYLIALLAKKSK